MILGRWPASWKGAGSVAIAVTLAQLVVTLGLALSNFGHPYAVDGGRSSDHFSHMCSTILFASKGLDIYRRPVRENLEHSTQPKDIAFAQRNQLGTQELYVNPLDRDRPPLAINWSFQIRPYPPGVYALFAPVATLFHFEWISFAIANRVIILALVLVASGICFSLFRFATEATGRTGVVRLISAAVVSIWASLWALRGFYDVVALGLALLSLREWERRRWPGFVFYYGLSLVMHFRAVYYLPLLGFALWQCRATDSWRSPRLWIGIACAGVSLACMAIALPQLETFGGNNPLYHFYERGHELSGGGGLALALYGLATVLLVLARAWPALLCLVSYGVFLVRTPQTYPWHTLFLVPLLVLCAQDVRGRWSAPSWLAVAALITWLGNWVYGVPSMM